MKRLAFSLCVIFVVIGIGQENPPGFGGQAQYRLGVGARALALAGAFTAVAEGPESVYWNPAAASWAQRGFGGMHTQPFAGLAGDLGIYVNYLGVVSSYGVWGLAGGWFNTHVSGIPYAEGDVIGTFDYDSSVFLFGGGLRQEFEFGAVAAGLTLKLYRETMLQGYAQGLGLDLGVIVDLGGVRVGYCSQDIGGTRYQWQGTGQRPVVEVPWVHRLGVAARWWEGLVLTVAEAEFVLGNVPDLKMGLEWAPVSWFFLRGGVRLTSVPNRGYQPVWSLGLGVSWGAFSMDVAYLHNPLSGLALPAATYVFSLNVRF